MENLLSANTDYCILLISDGSLNVICTGDQSPTISTVTSAEDTTHTTVENPKFIFGVVGSAVAIGIVATVSMFIIRKRRAKCRRKEEANVKQDDEDNQYAEIDSLPKYTTNSSTAQIYEIEVAKEASKADKNPTDRNIMIPDLLSKILLFEKDSRRGFTEEFRSIPFELKLDNPGTSNGQLLHDISQNKAIVTHEKSRVQLQDKSGTDYFNANFIKNTLGKRAYIASQGPSRDTVHRFWQMVWQERVSVIVDLEENKGEEKYWPHLANGEY
ncbi:receptor-type tyrosine-protein phosphatase kappa-like isoform X2 [Crassostrea virginica]